MCGTLSSPTKPKQMDTESSGEDTDRYWPLEEIDPIHKLIIIPDEITKPSTSGQSPLTPQGSKTECSIGTFIQTPDSEENISIIETQKASN